MTVLESEHATVPGSLAVERETTPARRTFRISPELHERIAVRVFAAYVGAAWFLLVFHFGRERWFGRDEWNFFTSRDGGDLWSVIEAQGEHVTIVPVLVFRAFFNVFGLRYEPYLVLVVSMHIALVVLLRVIMRRAGVGPWISTAVAGVFALFGRGDENILWTFQIGFIGSVLYGLTHVVLADHSGPIGRRDALGVGAGLLGVASSGVGPVMIGAVAVTTFIRRGERAALFHAGPPLAFYVLWQAIVRPPSAQQYFGAPSLSTNLEWLAHGIDEPIRGLALNQVVAPLLSITLAAGLIAAAVSIGRKYWRRLAVPLTLLACAPIFYVLVAQARWGAGIWIAGSSRYVYVATALILPAMGVAISGIAQRWRTLTPVAVALLVFGVPANIRQFSDRPIFGPAYYEHERQVILGIAHSPLLDEAAPWVRFEPEFYKGKGLTVEWMRQAVADGRVPDPGPIPSLVANEFPVRLFLAQHDFDESEPYVDCPRRTDPIDLTLVRGQRLRLNSEVYVTNLADGVPISNPVRFLPDDGSGVLSVEGDELTVRVSGAWGTEPYSTCLIE